MQILKGDKELRGYGPESTNWFYIGPASLKMRYSSTASPRITDRKTFSAQTPAAQLIIPSSTTKYGYPNFPTTHFNQPGHAQVRKPAKISSRSGRKKLRNLAELKRGGVAKEAPRSTWWLVNQGSEYSR